MVFQLRASGPPAARVIAAMNRGLEAIQQALGQIDRAATKDMLLLFAALILLSLFLPRDMTLGSIDPHPFWIPVLVVSAKYGSRPGLLSATIAAVLSVGWIDSARGSGEDLYAYTSKLFVDPALWIAAALIVGTLRDRMTDDIHRLEIEAKTLREDRRLIAEKHLELLSRQNRLEQRLSMSDPHPAQDLLAGLSALRKAEGDEVWQRLEEAAQATFGRCVLAVNQRGSGRMITTIVGCGGMPAKVPQRRPRYKRALFKALSSGAAALVASNPDEAELLKGAIAAVAVAPPDKPPHAILICEALDASAFGSDGDGRAKLAMGLRLLAEALEPALSRTISFRQLQKPTIQAYAA